MGLGEKVERKHKVSLPTGLNNNFNYIDDYQINTECDEEIQISIDIREVDRW